MEAKHLLTEVIVPTLKYLELDTPAARRLLLGTAAQESHMGRWLKQIKGPALGIYQMEPATHDDIWNHYLKHRPRLATKVEKLLCPGFNRHEQLKWNLAYATAMARVHYFRVPYALPGHHDIAGLATYWKNFYNSALGKGTVEEFEHNYGRFVL